MARGVVSADRRDAVELHDVRLIAIVESEGREPSDLLARASSLARHARPGSLMFQLRDKLASARNRMRLGRTLRELSADAGQRFFVNDRVDLALLLDADGIHLGRDALSPKDARRMFAGRALGITCALHEPLGVVLEEVDGVLLSPICEPRKGRSALGVAALGRARAAVPADVALFALGGVTSENAESCLRSGATGVAAIGAIWDALDVEGLVTALGIARG